MQVSHFEKLASHPEVVEAAKAEAREKDEVVTRSKVLSMIKQPHVVNNSGNNEWYTPAKYIEIARTVLGEIDLDPASCEHANKTVKASKYYSREDDGLTKPWNGKVWMNPPYSADLITKFAQKLVDEFNCGNMQEAIVLVNNATETTWFSKMSSVASAIAFPRGRIRYESTTHEMNTPLQGQAFIYIGEHPDKFCREFLPIGLVVITV